MAEIDYKYFKKKTNVNGFSCLLVFSLFFLFVVSNYCLSSSYDGSAIPSFLGQAYSEHLKSCNSSSPHGMSKNCLNLAQIYNLSNETVASSPRISASNNNVFVVWEEGHEGKSNIAFRHSSDGGTTFAPKTYITTFLLNEAGNANMPDIASFGNNVYVVWKSASGVHLIRSNDNGTTFGPATALELTNDTNITDVNIAASEKDNVYVVWKSASGVHLIRSNDNGTTFFNNIVTKSAIDKDQSYSSPRISASNNNVFVVWEEGHEGKSNIAFRHSSDGGISFGPAVNLNEILNLSSILYQPEIAYTSDNTIAIKINTITKGILLYETRDGGSTFGTATTLTNNTNVSDLRLAASENNVYIVWKNSSLSNNNIYFQKFVSSSGLTIADGKEKTMLSDNIALPVSAPRISASNNNVFVVWEEGHEGKSNIAFRHSSDGGTTFAPKTYIASNGLDLSIGNANQPEITSFENNVYIVWKNSSGIQLSKSNNSGTTFGTATTLTNNTNVSDLRLAASENNVYIVWKDIIKGSPAVFFKLGSKDAVNFNPVIRLSDENSSGYDPLIKIMPNNFIFVAWTSSEGGDILYTISNDNGSSFKRVHHIGSSSDNSSASDVKLASSSNNIYLIWKDGGFSVLQLDYKTLESQTIDFLKLAGKKMNVWSSNALDLAVIEDSKFDSLLMVWVQPVYLESEPEYEYRSIYLAQLDIGSQGNRL